MGCCFKKDRSNNDDSGDRGDDQPLISDKTSPKNKNKKGGKNGRQPADPNPFHKPSKW